MKLIKEYWSQATPKAKKIMAGGGALLGLVILSLAMGSEEPKDKKSTGRSGVELSTDIFASDKGKADMEAMAREMGAIRKGMENMAKDNAELRNKVRDYEMALGQIREVSKDPEAMKSILDGNVQLQKQFKELESWTKNAVKNGVTLKSEASDGLGSAPTSQAGQAAIPGTGVPGTILVDGKPMSAEELATLGETKAKAIREGHYDPFGTGVGPVIGDTSKDRLMKALQNAQDNKAFPGVGAGAGTASNPAAGTDPKKTPGAIRVIEDTASADGTAKGTGRTSVSPELAGKTEREVAAAQGAQAKKATTIVLPTGSIIQGILVNGMDAPTSMASQKEPHPVLIRIDDLAFLPNRYRANVRDCHIVGSGYGDIASERAYIRTERISCVMRGGRIADVNMRGYVTGADGAVGLRGKLVSKQGAIIQKAMLAGFFGGIAEAVRPQPIQTVQTGPTAGGVQYDAPNLSDVAKSGGYGGVNSALSRVSEFYLTQAKSIFPVVEIGALRKANVILTATTKIDFSGQQTGQARRGPNLGRQEG